MPNVSVDLLRALQVSLDRAGHEATCCTQAMFTDTLCNCGFEIDRMMLNDAIAEAERETAGGGTRAGPSPSCCPWRQEYYVDFTRADA
jgi:hypothetical protein